MPTALGAATAKSRSCFRAWMPNISAGVASARVAAFAARIVGERFHGAEVEKGPYAMTAGTRLFQAVNDYPCEACGHPMRCRRSRTGVWFYGCSRWPKCHYTFDADQNTGEPFVHTRFGVPFRANLKRSAGLFAALKSNPFDLAKGKALVVSAKTSQTKREKALKEAVRDEALSFENHWHSPAF